MTSITIAEAAWFDGPALARVEAVLSSLFSAEHPSMGELEPGSLTVAGFLIECAANGRADREAVVSLATGVELMALAVREHYVRFLPRPESDPSLSVLAGDRLYALAMRAICAAGRSDLVRVAAAAVADIAAMTSPEDGRRRSERIAQAAVDMAAMAASLSEEAVSGFGPRIPEVAAAIESDWAA